MYHPIVKIRCTELKKQNETSTVRLQIVKKSPPLFLRFFWKDYWIATWADERISKLLPSVMSQITLKSCQHVATNLAHPSQAFPTDLLPLPFIPPRLAVENG